MAKNKSLSLREAQVLSWFAAGYHTPEVANLMGLSKSTISGYAQRAKVKLGATSLAQAVVKALQMELIEYPESGEVQISSVNQVVRRSMGLGPKAKQGPPQYKIREAIVIQAAKQRGGR